MNLAGRYPDSTGTRQVGQGDADVSEPVGLLIAYAVTLALAVTVYWLGLGSAHRPTTVDELTYVHITRVTAGSGQLLPLRTEIEPLRNLKPPLLFWQGIASTHWGEQWTRWHLRYPCLLYTLLTACLLFLLGRKLSGRAGPGLLASVVFLAFFSTFRYGPVFLTDSPLVLWLWLPFFIALYWGHAACESRVWFPLACSVALGMGALYKSLALAAPVILALGWWYWQRRGRAVSVFVRRDSWKLAAIAGVAAGIFSLWFALDPDPQAIWREFVLKENMRKFAGGPSDYIGALLWGKESIWKFAAAYPLNAGLLAAPVVALFYLGWRDRKNLSEAEKLLWVIVLTYFVVFALQNERAERYLLPAMPAVALLTAVNWHRFNRHILRIALITAGLATAGLTYGSIRIDAAIGSSTSLGAWLLAGVIAALVIASLVSTKILRASVLPAVFLFYLALAMFMQPLDGALGRFDDGAVQAVRGKQLWVPSRQNAREEGYRFLLPGADIHAYHSDLRLTPAELAAKYPLFIVRLPVTAPEPVDGRIIGRRLDIGSHHRLPEMIEMLRGRVYEHLLVKELLVARAHVPDAQLR